MRPLNLHAHYVTISKHVQRASPQNDAQSASIIKFYNVETLNVTLWEFLFNPSALTLWGKGKQTVLRVT